MYMYVVGVASTLQKMSRNYMKKVGLLVSLKTKNLYAMF